MGTLDSELGEVGDRINSGITELAALVDDAAPGWSRTVFSEPYRQARPYVARRMSDAGLDVHVDAVGNVIGRRAGSANGSPIVTGSHTDTVQGGGRFDGMVGVLAGIEVARMLRDSGTQLDHDLLVVDFLGEEANDFGVSCLGSRAISGLLSEQHLNRTDRRGHRLGDTLDRFGADPDRALDLSWRPGGVHAFIELHVEQGPLLERKQIPIGIVTAIAGIERLTARFVGRADHAGTMPMGERLDALAAAAQAVLTIEREGCGAPIHGVSTTGRLASGPGAFNVVPDRAQLWAEVRSVDAQWLRGAKRRLVEDIARDAAGRGVDVDLEWLNDQDPVPTSRSVQDRMAGAADRVGIPWSPVPSGAGHDAAHMAQLGPMGMIFIPSLGGRSHCPEEWTEPQHIVTGVQLLLYTVLDVDGLDSLVST